jgi:Bacterial RNA polymerase, alpha chain C terminal domain
VNFVGFFNDIILASRKFVRGLAEIPSAAARRIDRAHDQADRNEGIKQEKIKAKQLPAPDSTKVADQIEDFLGTLQAEGVCVEYRELENGVPAIVLVRPELRDDSIRLAQAALLSSVSASAATLHVEMVLPKRIAKLLVSSGIRTVETLALRSDAELLAIDGFGQKSLIKVHAALKRLGLRVS